jgi:putative FmdB family regulatory protein
MHSLSGLAADVSLIIDQHWRYCSRNMPIYEYRCKKCGAHLERRQSVTDAPLSTCEECGGQLEKQWSLSGFQFKGQGWYVTDYSKSGSQKAANGDGTEKSAAKESTPASETASNTAKKDSQESTSADLKKEQ